MIARKKKSRNFSDCLRFNVSVFWFSFLFFLRCVVNTFFSILLYFPILNQKVSKMIQMIMNPDQSQIISFLGGVRWVNFYYSSLFFHFKRKDVQDDIQMITNSDQSQIISPYQGRRRSSRTVDAPDFATRGLGSRSGRVILLCTRAKHFTFVLSPLRNIIDYWRIVREAEWNAGWPCWLSCDEGLITLETSALKPFMVANLCYQLYW